MNKKKSFTEYLAYGFLCLSIILFFSGIMAFDSPSEWENDRIAFFMRNSSIGYVILASFCFATSLIAACGKHYSFATIFASVPTSISFCFFMFGVVSENNSTSWLLMFLSSLGLYPILYIDKKTNMMK